MKNVTRLAAALAILAFIFLPFLSATAQAPNGDSIKAAPSSSSAPIPAAPAQAVTQPAPEAMALPGSGTSIANLDKIPTGPAPDPHANNVLADFMKGGVKVFYMGQKAGWNAWFLFKDNQIQIAYSAPDNRNIIFGAMYDALGSNITADQIKQLYDSNREVYTILTNYNNAQAQMMSQPGHPSPSASGITMGSASDTSQLLPPTITAGERLMRSLQSAQGVDLGSATAPKIYMVADPNCPHCQATWKSLRATVLSGKVQIRIVPIDALGTPESEKAAAQFLRSANPLEAWDKYIVDGDKAQLAGTPDEAALSAVRNNHALVDSWHIEMTPYMVYRSKQGQVKIEQGEPHDPNAIINDVGL